VLGFQKEKEFKEKEEYNRVNKVMLSIAVEKNIFLKKKLFI